MTDLSGLPRSPLACLGISPAAMPRPRGPGHHARLCPWAAPAARLELLFETGMLRRAMPMGNQTTTTTQRSFHTYRAFKKARPLTAEAEQRIAHAVQKDLLEIEARFGDKSVRLRGV